jgi:hypothetical protein
LDLVREAQGPGPLFKNGQLVAQHAGVAAVGGGDAHQQVEDLGLFGAFFFSPVVILEYRDSHMRGTVATSVGL